MTDELKATIPQVELNSSQLEEKINAMQNGTDLEQPPIEAQVIQSNTTPSNVSATEVKVEQSPVQVSSDVNKPTVVPQTEKKPEQVAAFDSLALKKNIHTPDELASMYSNLEREYTRKAMELSEIRKQEIAKQLPNQQPQVTQSNPMELAKQKFLEDFATDPFNALQTFQSIVNKPIIIEQKKNQFNAKLVALSNSPETADFNTKEIQDKISEIVNANPRRYINSDGLVDTDILEDLYYQAKGKLSVGQKQNPVLRNVSQPIVPIEGKTKATYTIPNNTDNMTAEQLEAVIIAKQRGQ